MLLIASTTARSDPKLIPTVSDTELLLLREETRDAFLHAYDSYMKHGFPYDEIKPLSCLPRRHDKRERGTLDDVLGGFMLTLVDSLDSLIVMKEYSRFKEALNIIKESLSFDRDISISVFEANIRVLGGLLSAHQLASALFDTSVYDGRFLLDKAKDLGDRLLPAFDTRTGVPTHKVNLRHGVDPTEVSHNCPAAGASFLVEMGLLSRLTGDPRYELAGRKAIKAVWERRSDINLIGAMINIKSGKWVQTHSGIGAGIDSFFETLLKSHILLGDMDLLQWFDDAYDAVQEHTLRNGVHIEVDMSMGRRGPAYSTYVSALQAFWPGLQTLAGYVQAAEATFAALANLWRRHDMLPDMYDVAKKTYLSHSQGYPLRPELIESAYHLYTATGNNEYLNFVKNAFHSLQNNTKVKCGYAAVADVRTGRLDDRMDSYFLAETLMYAFLLFDDALPQHLRASVFCRGEQGLSDDVSANVSISCISPYEIENTDVEIESVEPGLILEDGITQVASGGLLTISIPVARTVRQSNISIGALQNCLQLSQISELSEVKESSETTAQKQCIPKVSSIFSTEGHLLIIDPIIRPLVSRQFNSDHAERHTCQALY